MKSLLKPWCSLGLSLPLLAASLLLVTAPSPTWAQPLSPCDTVAGNLVTNCGFETGDFTGWTQSGDTSYTGVELGSNSGDYEAYMGPVSGNGYLTQNVGDNSTLYSISFYLNNIGSGSNNFTLLWNGTDVGPSLVDAGGFGYTQYVYTVPGNAGAGSNTLSFQFYNGPTYWHLDDIVVLNVPEPGSLILLGSGILGLAGMNWKSRRKVAA